ncbi:MAG TPA: DUF5752 family protein [Methylomirabilota bacterium]|nr:DUF5752 family protein [Methylomirabilota bacterium]
MKKAGAPFVFIGCIELLEDVGLRAQSERELIERLEEVPAGSIFYHTYGYFLRHRYFVGPYANDFATWAVVHLRDQMLGERLAVVDPFEFDTLEQLREELISVIDDHLSHLSAVPRADYGEPFYFVQSHVVEVPTGHEAWGLEEFRGCLADVDASAIYYHLVEARARLGRRSGDFAAWLRESLSRPDLAEHVERIDLYLSSLERVRARVLNLLVEAIEQAEEAYQEPT